MPAAVLCTQHHGLLVYDGNVMTVLLGLSQYYLWSPYCAVDSMVKCQAVPMVLMITYIALFSALLSRLTALTCGST